MLESDDAAMLGARRCHAKSKQRGERCKSPAVPGATVCHHHGGAAPQVKRKAALRLAALVDPAIATLAREMTNQSNRASDRIRAVENVLDRAGVPRRMDVDSDMARALLVERLLALHVEEEEESNVVQGSANIIEKAL